jgi:hypothetical protein
MSFPEELFPTLAAHAATDPETARLLELLAKVDEALGEVRGQVTEMSKGPGSEQRRCKVSDSPLMD